MRVRPPADLFEVPHPAGNQGRTTLTGPARGRAAAFDDATARGWQREIEGHELTRHRIERLLTDLDQQS